MLGFAGGVMIAASYWSLLAPAIEMSDRPSYRNMVSSGNWIFTRWIFLRGIDKISPSHPNAPIDEAEGFHLKERKRSTCWSLPSPCIISRRVGGGDCLWCTCNGERGFVGGALTLALGIGIQNLPEGVAVSMPLRGEGMSRRKSFFYGQFSGMVEPIAAVIGAFAVSFIEPLLPYALSFAAGAMIFVVAEETIPSSQEKGIRIGFNEFNDWFCINDDSGCGIRLNLIIAKMTDGLFAEPD